MVEHKTKVERIDLNLSKQIDDIQELYGCSRIEASGILAKEYKQKSPYNELIHL